MNNNKVKDDSLAKLQLLLGINREFTENDWWHIVGHYIASLKIKPQHGMYVPNPDIIRQSPSALESPLTIWHRRGLAVEYCLRHPPDFSLFEC
jgi:hypothetical protein